MITCKCKNNIVPADRKPEVRKKEGETPMCPYGSKVIMLFDPSGLGWDFINHVYWRREKLVDADSTGRRSAVLARPLRLPVRDADDGEVLR